MPSYIACRISTHTVDPDNNKTKYRIELHETRAVAYTDRLKLYTCSTEQNTKSPVALAMLNNGAGCSKGH